MQKHSEKKTYFKPGDGNVVCLCCVPTRLKTVHFKKNMDHVSLCLWFCRMRFHKSMAVKPKNICFEVVT